MEINASLKRIHLKSPQPHRLAEFYEISYGMTITENNENCICQATDRQLGVSEGSINQIGYALFQFANEPSWKKFLDKTANIATADVSRFVELPKSCFAVKDPDGNCIVFQSAADDQVNETEGVALHAQLQHFALRTTNMETMARFYEDELGFVVSDRVIDEKGQLRAIFFRTNTLHHAMALFLAPVKCFDHQSFEVPDWDSLKAWADHMGKNRVEIVWGVGRHGPGDDVFFMVRDPDGNLVEISSEIEVCTPGRAVGIWPNEMHTLNLWGPAILRS